MFVFTHPHFNHHNTHTHTHTARLGGLFRAQLRWFSQICGHSLLTCASLLTLAWLWLWLWLWLRLLNPLELLKLNDRSNRFPGQFAAPLGITRAGQRFAPVDSNSILSFIKRINQRSNRLAIILR
jgi:hypothetical protein